MRPEILPNPSSLTIVKTQSCPGTLSVSTDVAHAPQGTLQSAAKGTEELERGLSSLKGSAFPGEGKNTGSGSVGGHTPLFSGLRGMGTGHLTLSKQCPWTVVITVQASWRGKE